MSKFLPTCYRRGASLPPAPPATPVGRGKDICGSILVDKKDDEQA